MELTIANIAYISGGGFLGFLYYKLVGCRSGSCPLTSSPVISVITGIIVASLIVFQK
jgi:hypothetical protein